jgi:hypothetical protein
MSVTPTGKINLTDQQMKLVQEVSRKCSPTAAMQLTCVLGQQVSWFYGLAEPEVRQIQSLAEKHCIPLRG